MFCVFVSSINKERFFLKSNSVELNLTFAFLLCNYFDLEKAAAAAQKIILKIKHLSIFDFLLNAKNAENKQK
jgi:hypothetical protein